jgi:hypothetical protein
MSVEVLGRVENINAYVYVDGDEIRIAADYIYEYVNVSGYLFVDVNIFVVEMANVAVDVTYTTT